MKNYIKVINTRFNPVEDGEKLNINIKGTKVTIDLIKKKWKVDGVQIDSKTSLDLTKEENWSVLIFTMLILEKGYSSKNIILEKTWKLGHKHKGRLDIAIKNKNGDIVYMFEVKTPKEFAIYTNSSNKNSEQILSYVSQEKTTRIGSYVTVDFDNNGVKLANIFITDEMKISYNTDGLIEVWNKLFDKSQFIFENDLYDEKLKIIKIKDLEKVDTTASDILFTQLLTILRLNSISDKSNAFDKMVNLILAKIVDEATEDTEFNIKTIDGSTQAVKGARFQYINGIDTPESFVKRLYDLYKEGMGKYLLKNIIDYNDEDIDELILSETTNLAIREIIDNLRLKKDNSFSFLNVFDEETFIQNFNIMKEIVILMQNFKFKYDERQEFLGDFFERLLSTSLKQESGQFFTPTPMVDFVVESLPIQEQIEKSLKSKEKDFFPKGIDYAAGAGHFILSYMNKVQRSLNNINGKFKTTEQQSKELLMAEVIPYSWAKDRVVAIEKDARLAKTIKVATFLSGDGDSTVLNADGINKFNSKQYIDSIIFSDNKINPIFDYVVANPPYSVKGFMKTFILNDISEKTNDFELLEKMNISSSQIENFFIERSYQLLKDGGVAALVLPQSVISGNNYTKVREYIFKRFKLMAIFASADVSFSGTTTSPVILFLKKKTKAKYNPKDKVLIIASPKYIKPVRMNATDKSPLEVEKKWLGYKFSSSKTSAGTSIINNNLAEVYSPLVKLALKGEFNKIEETKNSFVREFKDIVIDLDKKSIYPMFKKQQEGFLPLSHFVDIINEKSSKDIPYIEISNIVKNSYKFSKKDKKGNLAKSGDILLPTLLPVPGKVSMVGLQDIQVSSVIAVLRPKKPEYKEFIYNYLKGNTNDVLYDIWALSDGFKRSYSKITQEILMNKIYIKSY